MSTTHPRWTSLGTLSSPARGLVDGRGRVSTQAGWALDWWVGAEDRWHLPGQEASVRQHLVGDAPVVETAMHIPGGDAWHRAYAVRDRGPDGDGRDLVVVEIENRSAVPFAVALVVAPFDPDAPDADGGSRARAGSVRQLALEGSTLLVDGRPGVVGAKAPARAAACADHRDLQDRVTTGQAGTGLDPRSWPAGSAGAALIYPLPHTAVLRVVLPLGPDRPGRRRGGDRRPTAATEYPTAVPTAEQVAKGWEAQVRRPMTVTVPDACWTAVTEASRRFLLLGAGDARPWVDAVSMVGALDRWGFAAEATRVLTDLGDSGHDSHPVDGPALVALADHWRLTRDRELVETHAAAIAAGVRRADRPSRRERGALGGDLAWRARGLRGAAELLAAIGQPEAAEAVGRRARLVIDQLRPELPVERAPLAVAHPVWPELASPARTLDQAALDVARGDGPGGLERVAWALSVVSPTLVWPDALDPDHPDLASGLGHDPVAGAAWLIFIRDLLVREADDGVGSELALCSWLPRSWRGQGFEVHHAPTAAGLVSYAVRWHGERPALLWELDPHAGPTPGPVTLRAPGLDAAWSTREPRGEALLAAAVDDQPVGPGQVGLDAPGSPGEGASFS